MSDSGSCCSELSEFTEVSNNSQYEDDIIQTMILCRSPIEEVLELCHDIPRRYTIPVQQLELHNKESNKKYKLYVDRVESDYCLNLKKYNAFVTRHVLNLLTITTKVASAINEMIPFNEYQTGTIYFDYNDKWRLGVIIEEV